MKKLRINRTTLRNLTPAILRRAAGGMEAAEGTQMASHCGSCVNTCNILVCVKTASCTCPTEGVLCTA